MKESNVFYAILGSCAERRIIFMKQIKVALVFDTRPEAIKMCPLILEMQKHEEIECRVYLTGQHKEMLDQVMDILGIKADKNLSIMSAGQTLSDITVNVLEKLGQILDEDRPDLLLVHGDTTTSFAAALVGFYRQIPVGHVEAGLRTYNLYSPYPEEFNRQAVDVISELYFAPTELAKKQLIEEKKKPENIFVTGNTVIDALKNTVSDSYQNENLTWADGSRMILMTCHRRENIGEPMRRIFRAVKRIVHDFPDVKIIYPIHKNPKVREIANEILSGEDRIRMIEPLDVFNFHNFMARSFLIMTDSGGIQEEAPAFGKPVLVLRDTTERPEGVEAGTLKLVGTQEDDVYAETKRMLTDKNAYQAICHAVNPYGDGHASERIVEAILSRFYNVNFSNEFH